MMQSELEMMIFIEIQMLTSKKCESMLGDDRMLLEITYLSFTTTIKDSDKEKEERS